MEIKFCDYDEEFFRLSGIWLRDPEIKQLTMTSELDEAERINWYRSLQLRKDYFIEGIKVDNISIGVLGLKNVNKEYGMAEYFGYIGNKKYIGGYW